MKKQGFAKVRAAMKGKGFIVALALSVAAVGFSTYYAYNNIMNGFGGENSDELFIEVDKNQPGVPLVTTTAQSTIPQRQQPLPRHPLIQALNRKPSLQTISLPRLPQEQCLPTERSSTNTATENWSNHKR